MLMMYYKRHIISSPGAFFKSSSENRNLWMAEMRPSNWKSIRDRIFKSYQGVRHNESQPVKSSEPVENPVYTWFKRRDFFLGGICDLEFYLGINVFCFASPKCVTSLLSFPHLRPSALLSSRRALYSSAIPKWVVMFLWARSSVVALFSYNKNPKAFG